MFKIVCYILTLTLILPSVLQQLCSKAAEGKLKRERSFMVSQSQLATPAPFGRYVESVNGVVLELVRVPTGTFLMGNDRSPYPEEKPAHLVNVKSFYIGQYEITRQQWNIVVDTLPRVSRNLEKQYIGPPILEQTFEPTTPAHVIFWEDAVEFCERLTRLTSRRYRLPSEAEWEFACRAGTTSEFSFGDEANYGLANINSSVPGPSPLLLTVGKKGYANTWGLYDMPGNVGEWCLDTKHPNYIGAPVDGSAWIQGGDANERSMRGGTYLFGSEMARSSARKFWSRAVRASGFGFRVVAEINPVIGNGSVTATSAASYLEGSLASEAIAALFGNSLSEATQVATNLPLPVTLASTSITIKDSRGNEHLAPLFFASPNQVNFQVPSNLPSGAATIRVVNNGNIIATGTTEIVGVSPGLFTADASGRDLPAALVLRVKNNGEQVYEPVAQFDPAANRFVAVSIDVSNPAEQVFLLLFGTGLRHRSALANVVTQVGGVDAEVLFAEAQGDFVGLDQVNLRLPQALAGRGEVNVRLTVDGKTANTVAVGIK